MTQKIFALAPLAVPFHYVTFSTENQAPTGDYGRWSEILTRGDPWENQPPGFWVRTFFLVHTPKFVR